MQDNGVFCAGGRQRYPRIFLLFFLHSLAVIGLTSICKAEAILPPEAPGIVVLETRQGTAGEEAGLLSGDLLLTWRRDSPAAEKDLPNSGNLALPFDLIEVFLEQVPRGRVVIEGRRGGQTASWILPAGAPSDERAVQATPASPEISALDQKGRALLNSGKVEEGIATFQAAIVEAKRKEANETASWLLAEAARLLGEKNRWAEADAFYSEALSLPISQERRFINAQILREWGELFHSRSAWERAKNCFARALAIDQQKRHESLSAASSLTGLAEIDNFSNGPDQEEKLFERALQLRHRLSPGSSDEAASWFSWGNAKLAGGEFSVALEYYDRAVQILQKLSTGQLMLADVFSYMAYTSILRGDLDRAEANWLKAEALLRRIAPASAAMAGVNNGLGLVAMERGDLRKSEELLTRSIQVYGQAAPESFDEADALSRLGRLEQRVKKLESSSQHLCRAMEVIEIWRNRFQANEELRTRWGLGFADYYHECAESLVAIGKPDEAFLAIEKGRGRAFQELRAERRYRQTGLSAEQHREWDDLDAEYDRVQEQLDKVRSRKESRLEEVIDVEGRLREIRRQKEEILASSLPPGSIRYPGPLSLAEARQQLERGTALVSYSVGRKTTLLFVLFPEKDSSPGWKVLSLEVGAGEWKKRVGFFRDVLFEERSKAKDLPEQARALYDLLLRPAEPYLENCERIIISPDGPLNHLPFAALLRESSYLIEWKPLHYTLSATVYADLLAQRRPSQERLSAKLVAFGDPSSNRPSAADKSLDPQMRKALRSGLGHLPAAHKEVEEIRRLFPNSQAFLGNEATEEQVKTSARDATLFHFAVHGLLDERNPLNSALVLSGSKKQGIRSNGLLQAWEIMEKLPLDADLVTLSACDTALGQEIRGEGLIGLTRAFQYAGARSVVATLWGISDRSTADFMAALYSALRAGKPKDEALRSAQIAQIHSSKPQPFYWAAFQLYGDWR